MILVPLKCSNIRILIYPLCIDRVTILVNHDKIITYYSDKLRHCKDYLYDRPFFYCVFTFTDPFFTET